MLLSTANIKPITELREKTAKFMRDLKTSNKPVIVLKGSSPQMVAMSPDYFNKLLEMLEDYEDARLASELISKPEKGGHALEDIANELNIKL